MQHQVHQRMQMFQLPASMDRSARRSVVRTPDKRKRWADVQTSVPLEAGSHSSLDAIDAGIHQNVRLPQHRSSVTFCAEDKPECHWRSISLGR
ncbi:unnamed protein product [Protopolystoma xenopodis]|uniref:Uncharacterized protein n=1 Tax=Protopolystoma xenopodis TaxID=117903 RepID=A0A3S5BDV3_9PLAT|nr:unnamed protein product [Protopolystoma xenopodis]